MSWRLSGVCRPYAETSYPGVLSTSAWSKLGDRPISLFKEESKWNQTRVLLTLCWQEPGHLIFISYFWVTIHPPQTQQLKASTIYPAHYSTGWRFRLEIDSSFGLRWNLSFIFGQLQVKKAVLLLGVGRLSSAKMRWLTMCLSPSSSLPQACSQTAAKF